MSTADRQRDLKLMASPRLRRKVECPAPERRGLEHEKTKYDAGTTEARCSPLSHFPFPFLNAAATAVAAFTLTTQVEEDPEQPPLQPVKETPFLFGVAVSVSSVPWGYVAEQSERQLIPAGVLVTVPGPEVATVSV